MRIVHHFFTDCNTQQVEQLKSLGINLEVGYDSFQIEEGDVYQKIKPLMAKWGFDKNKGVGTFYNKKEIDSAELLEYGGAWINGYPQPEDNWIDSMDITYDLSKYCNKCGCGSIQKAPFRLKKRPVWRNRSAFELEWVYDEIFIKKEIYEQIFKPLGMGYWDVLLFKKNELIEDTVQLKIPTSSIALDLSKQQYEKCTQCHRIKYLNQVRGYFPNFIDNKKPKHQIQKSQEYYGSGQAADKWIIVTQELRQTMLKQGIKGIYRPLSL